MAGAEIARLLETLQVASAGDVGSIPTGSKDRELAYARVCYDHLAGQLGVALLRRLQTNEWIVSNEAGISLTHFGRDRLTELGIELHGSGRRIECKECMDWSERRMHLAGNIGAQMLQTMLARGWLFRRLESRAVLVTQEGRRQLKSVLDLFHHGG